MARGLAGGIAVLAVIIGSIWWFNRAEEVTRQQERSAKPQRPVSKEEEERMLETLRVGAPPIAPNGPYPKLVAELTTYNFGTIGTSEVQRHKFPIKNSGTVPLKLVVGRTSCECMRGRLGKGELSPGESTELEVEFRGQGFGSEFGHTFHVYSNDPESRDVKFIITGNVLMRIAIHPGPTWRLGDISGDQPVTTVGFIGSPTVDKFQILGIESESPELTVKSEPASPELLKEKRCKSGYAIIADLAPKFPPGKFESQFIVHTDIDKKAETPGIDIALQVIASRPGPMRYLSATDGARWYSETRTLFLGRFTAAQGKSSTVPFFVQQKSGDKPFEATEITSSTPHLAVELKPAPDSELGSDDRKLYNLKFSVPPGKPAASHDEKTPATVLIKTNHPELPELEIRVIYVSL